MFTQSGSELAFDSIRAVEGKFFVDPSSSEINADIEMTYVNRESGTTYGKCTVKSLLFSKETIEALRTFLENVEKDFGSVVFKEGGRSVPIGSSSLGAESSEAPKALGGV